MTAGYRRLIAAAFVTGTITLTASCANDSPTARFPGQTTVQSAGTSGPSADATAPTTAEPPAPAASEPTAETAATGTTGEPQSGEGGEIFADNCAVCHGPSGEGDFGPSLTAMSNPQRVEEQVRNGGGGMPPFEGQLSEEQIDAVVRHVVEEIAGGG